MTFFSRLDARLPFWLRSVLLLVLFSVLSASRRHWQFIVPQVWAEDGTNVLPGLMLRGWQSMLEPVNGYLITLPKLISALSLTISALHYPFVSSLLSAICMGCALTAIALAPTWLRGRFVCALAVCMVPMDPEVFGLPLYMFWWSSLLLFLLVLWDETRPAPVWRLLFLLAGGMSSPIIMLVLPLLLARALLYRDRRTELLIAAAACGIAVVQCHYIVAAGGGSMPPMRAIVSNLVPIFFGHFALGGLSLDPRLLWCGGVFLLLVLAAWLWQSRRDLASWVLVFLLVGTIAMVVLRVDPTILNPRLTAQRYFFFPYVLIFWCLIQYAYLQGARWRQMMIGVSILAAMASSATVWSHRHDDLHWADHVRSCVQFENYNIPVETNGDAQNAWRTRLPGTACAALLAHAWISEAGSPWVPYAYTVVDKAASDSRVEVLGNTMNGMDFEKSRIEGYQVIGSYAHGDADTGDVLLKLHRGAAILYRAGPGRHGQTMQIVGKETVYAQDLPVANDWTTLEFSNLHLPDEFVVSISDTGRDWGEWSAVAVKIK